jgi:predicted ATP-grasp superfamily ATP-dependent carboligase
VPEWISGEAATNQKQVGKHSEEKMRGIEVLVTGADQRQGLSVIRSLGRRGVSVIAAGPSTSSIGFYSRYAKARWVYPSPVKNPKEFIESLVEAIQTYKVTIVMPVVESTLVAVNQYREEIEKHASLAMASREAVDLSLDKNRQIRLAQEHGIPVPKTCTPSSLEEAEQSIQGFVFPVVLKPSVKPSVNDEWGSAFKVSFIDSWEGLKDRLAIYFRYNALPVIQELCVGNGIGCGVLMDRGKALCCYQYHRGRENHPTGGVPVRYESMQLWPHVRDYSVRMLQAMNWNGVAQVEWKNIPGTQEVVLMEVNGRFWASLPGAIHAGMDFPFWLYELWTGRTGTYDKPYRTGIASRYLRGDLNRLELVLRGNPGCTSVPLPSRQREVLDFLLDFFRWRVKADIHSWGDLAPGLQEARDILSEFLKRFTSKISQGRA